MENATIVKADKGKTTVIIYSDDYSKKYITSWLKKIPDTSKKPNWQTPKTVIENTTTMQYHPQH